MVIDIPKERKIQEYRVALTPEAVGVLAGRGHRVFIKKDAGVYCSLLSS
jgi:alanine dehydrogenase